MYFGRQGILQGHLDLEHCEGQSVHFDFGMLNLAGGLFQLDLVYCTNKYFKLLIGHLYFKRERESKAAKRGPPLLGDGQFFETFTVVDSQMIVEERTSCPPHQQQ